MLSGADRSPHARAHRALACSWGDAGRIGAAALPHMQPQGTGVHCHAGIVVGEAAVVGNGVTIMQHVTLGGTGAEAADRHPKIGDHVQIGVKATILGAHTGCFSCPRLRLHSGRPSRGGAGGEGMALSMHAAGVRAGNIRVGRRARVAAGSMVLKPVEADMLVAGNPAKVIGKLVDVHPCIPPREA